MHKVVHDLADLHELQATEVEDIASSCFTSYFKCHDESLSPASLHSKALGVPLRVGPGSGRELKREASVCKSFMLLALLRIDSCTSNSPEGHAKHRVPETSDKIDSVVVNTRETTKNDYAICYFKGSSDQIFIVRESCNRRLHELSASSVHSGWK